MKQYQLYGCTYTTSSLLASPQVTSVFLFFLKNQISGNKSIWSQQRKFITRELIKYQIANWKAIEKANLKKQQKQGLKKDQGVERSLKKKTKKKRFYISQILKN